MSHSKKQRTLKLKVKLGVAAVFTVVIVCIVNFSISNIVDKITNEHIHVLGAQIINQAISEVLAEQGEGYQDLVEVTYGADKSVTSIQTDSVGVNKIRTEVTAGILEKIEKMDTMPVMVPLGNLSDIRFLQSRGPKVEFKAYPSGILTTKIVSEFNSAGINQTRHRLLLDLSVDVVCVGMFRHNETTVHSEYVLAETIIVGEIPESYTKLLFEENSKI